MKGGLSEVEEEVEVYQIFSGNNDYYIKNKGFRWEEGGRGNELHARVSSFQDRTMQLGSILRGGGHLYFYSAKG